MDLKRLASLAVFLVLVLAAAMPARGQEFRTEVRVILASNSDQGFDPRLTDLKPDLLALNYMSFQLLDQAGLSLRRDQAGRLAVPGGRRMTVVPRAMEGGKIGMDVEVTEGKVSLVKTHLRIENHGTVIIGGPPYQAGFLLLAVSVHF